MKSEYKILLTGMLAIGMFDALGSMVSNQLHFNYAYLGLGSILIYAAFGFWGTKAVNLKTGVLIAAGVGLFDATVGWRLAILFKANTGNIKNGPSTLLVWMITAVMVTGFAALCGLIGGGLQRMIRKK